MKKTYLLIIASLLLAVYACRRDYVNRHEQEARLADPSISLNVKDAQLYFSQLRAEQGEVVQDGNVKTLSTGQVNKKYVMFNKAYAGQTDSVSFVEAPLQYNKRSSSISQPKPGTDEVTPQQVQLLNSSFDRLVIFKNKKTGKIDQRILTYMPDQAYLQNHHNDASSNTINQLDKDFSGIIAYKEWNGKVVSMLKVVNGKGVRRFVPGGAAPDINAQGKIKVNGSNKTMTVVCEPVYVFTYEQHCWYSDPEHTQNEYCTDWVLISQVYAGYSQCTDDGIPGYDPCNDPANFNSNCTVPCTNCGGGGDSGSGSTTTAAIPEIIDSLNLCQSNILNALKGNDNYIGKILNQMARNVNINDIPEFSIKYITVPTLYDPAKPNNVISGVTTNTFYDRGPNQFSANIELAKDVSDHASNVYIAMTIVHETIHAYMASLLMRVGYGNLTKEQIGQLGYAEVFDDYVNMLTNAKRAELRGISNDAQYDHQYMANELLTTISQAIKDYDHYTQNDEFYWSLAWSGLQDSQTWKSFVQKPATSDTDLQDLPYALTQQRINKILNTIVAERSGQTTNNITVKGKLPNSSNCYN